MVTSAARTNGIVVCRAIQMSEMVGVFICHCGLNIAGVIDVKELHAYAETLPGVSLVEDYSYMCSEPGQELIRKAIREGKVNRVVVAACSPRMHEPTFRSVLSQEGMNPYLLDVANLREHDSWVHMFEKDKALEKAKDLVRMAVARAAKLEALTPREVNVEKTALVIGGGIAGISAALDLGDAGYKVYLVESSPTIGGHMAQLDKTFPTMDCSACILTPKMVSVARHPNVNLRTYAEVVDVQGYVGNFKVKIRNKPRYVDPKKCTACGDCASVCPIEVPSEFDVELTWRKAIYIPFPQAVPTTYTIDDRSCIGLKPLTCRRCEDKCGPRAINFDELEREEEITAGTIIVATGYRPYNPSNEEQYGYGIYPNVVTAIEMERMLNASGPTGGKVLRPSDMQEPKRIAFLHCIGSRDDRANSYCSRICCMYSMKQARQIKEKHPDAQVHEFFIDIRAYGKGFEEFYEKAAREYGVAFIRGKVAEVVEDQATHNLLVRAEDTMLGRPVEVETDLVVLSTALQPHEQADQVQALLRISRGPEGFFSEAHPKLRPVDTLVDGVFICGVAQGPKDIPDTVAQSKGAASGAASLMGQGKVSIEPYFISIDEEVCSGCKVCVDLCPYQAIRIEQKTAKANEALCKGCGVCVSSCPAGAIKANHFTDDQLMSQIVAAAGGA
jgi:heterodisulfide reductase subunit A